MHCLILRFGVWPATILVLLSSFARYCHSSVYVRFQFKFLSGLKEVILLN